MTSEARSLFVWFWLPRATEPVVAGRLDRAGAALFDRQPVLMFTYARSYLRRQDAISLFPLELPLVAGSAVPTLPRRESGWPERSPVPLAGCLRDAAPDAWGRRVINRQLGSDADVELGEATYLLRSDSDRVGALDFQSSSSAYVARGEPASLEQLLAFSDLVEAGERIPASLTAAAGHGTSIGGARPKAMLEHEGRPSIAKFSSSTDTRPIVKAEAVGMLLARRVGIDVPPVKVVRAVGKDVLLVERFDRGEGGTRRHMLSALTVLGLREIESRYASYADLAQVIRLSNWWHDAGRTLRELFTRLVFNICIGNTDDHLRNHAVFWDGRALRLTPAYDLCPQPRTTSVASHAIQITRGQNASQLRLARAVAADFGIPPREADDVIDRVLSTIREAWREACDEATLSQAERDLFWEREILNPYIFYDLP